jgi:hypothetical protein
VGHGGGRSADVWLGRHLAPSSAAGRAGVCGPLGVGGKAELAELEKTGGAATHAAPPATLFPRCAYETQTQTVQHHQRTHTR